MIHGLCNQRRRSNVRVAAAILFMSYVHSARARQSVSLSFLSLYANEGGGGGGGGGGWKDATAFLENVVA